MERFLVRNGSDSEDEETPPSGQYHLTPRQCITVYMCGVRPKDLKRVHSSQEEGSSYVRTYLQHKEKFANDHNGTDKICPGTQRHYWSNKETVSTFPFQKKKLQL